MSGSETRFGYVAIVGPPNVGKSTLLNALLGQKISIVSKRPQTTRNRVLGVLTANATQIVLVDTPGIHEDPANLNRYMVDEALASIEQIDCMLLVADASRPGQTAERGGKMAYVLDRIAETRAKAPQVVALNKIDLVRDRKALLPQIAGWQEKGLECVVPISARTEDGVTELLAELEKHLPVGAHLYSDDVITDRAERWLAAEFIREQVLAHCSQEVPHATAVDIEEFEERPDRGDVRIAATIWLERAGQKAIVIGSAGKMIKQIGTAAREQISGLLACPVHVALTVRVAKDWRKTAAGRKRFGYG